MEKTKIMLCCGAGFSSGFLAQKTRQAAKKQGLDVQVDARSESQVTQYLNDIDFLLLGPHYASQLSTYEKLAAGHDIKVAVIPQKIYGALNGQELLEFVKDLAD